MIPAFPGRMEDVSGEIRRHQQLHPDWCKPGPRSQADSSADRLAARAAPGLVNRCKSHRDFTASVRIYNQDVKIRVTPTRPKSRPGRVNRRGRILGWSRHSRRNAIHKLNNCVVRWRAFVTLTYHETWPDFEGIHRHLDCWLKRLRRLKPGIRYFWVLELQERGAPHIHLLCDRFIPIPWLSASWNDIADPGNLAHLAAGTSVEAVRNTSKVSAYLITKYLGKEAQKSFQGCTGRIWGTSRNVRCDFESYTFTGPHSAISRTLRPLLTAHRHRFSRFRWRGGSFTAYGLAALALPLLSLGASLTNPVPEGSSWRV